MEPGEKEYANRISGGEVFQVPLKDEMDIRPLRAITGKKQCDREREEET